MQVINYLVWASLREKRQVRHQTALVVSILSSLTHSSWQLHDRDLLRALHLRVPDVSDREKDFRNRLPLQVAQHILADPDFDIAQLLPRRTRSERPSAACAGPSSVLRSDARCSYRHATRIAEVSSDLPCQVCMRRTRAGSSEHKFINKMDLKWCPKRSGAAAGVPSFH